MHAVLKQGNPNLMKELQDTHRGEYLTFLEL
jgi:hypothetical protein